MSEPALCASLQDCQKSKTARWVGAWRLAPQRAMSLWPRRHSQILIVQGCAWVTWSGSGLRGGGAGDFSGDHFLQAGQILDVPAGAHLVMESRFADQMLHFDWRELPPALADAGPAARPVTELAWQWLHALGQLGWATGQLVRGLWRPGLMGRRAARVPA